MLAVPRRILVLDEPTAMPDPAGRQEVLAAVREPHDEGLTVAYVTQEMDEVTDADRVGRARARHAHVHRWRPDLFGDHDLVRDLGLGLPAAGEPALSSPSAARELAGPPLTLDELVAALEGAA